MQLEWIRTWLKIGSVKMRLYSMKLRSAIFWPNRDKPNEQKTTENRERENSVLPNEKNHQSPKSSEHHNSAKKN